MRKNTKTGSLLHCLATLALVLSVSSAARADFTIDPTPPAAFAFNITTTQDGVTSFTGSADSKLISVTTDVKVDVASGVAIISPDGSGQNQTFLREVTFTPTAGSNFTEFTFRGSVSLADTTLQVTVDDNVGNTFTFLIDKHNADFDDIGVAAIDGTNEFITKVSVKVIDTDDTTGSQFLSMKQIAFGYDTAPDTNPHITPVPSSIAMLISLAVPGLGFYRFRRRKTPAGV
jgi:hypothetical protein